MGTGSTEIVLWWSREIWARTGGTGSTCSTDSVEHPFAYVHPEFLAAPAAAVAAAAPAAAVAAAAPVAAVQPANDGQPGLQVFDLDYFRSFRSFTRV